MFAAGDQAAGNRKSLGLQRVEQPLQVVGVQEVPDRTVNAGTATNVNSGRAERGTGRSGRRHGTRRWLAHPCAALPTVSHSS